MTLSPGQLVELDVDTPAAGGRMIARHDGQVVFVLGAIPGERVRARIERADARMAFAAAEAVLDPSPHRLDPGFDIRCGGSLFGHIEYTYQLRLKAELVAEAYRRLGRIPLESPVVVAPSRPDGYRMRARLHVRGGRAGFYLEGTHTVCDAGPTRQLLPAAVEAVEAAVGEALAIGSAVKAVEISENLPGDERGLLLELEGGGYLAAGDPSVADPLSALSGGRVAGGELRRRPAAFFQGNRFLLPRLVTAVLDAVPKEDSVLDLYAGVGLFAIALAADGRARVTAVEGDRAAGADLEANAAQTGRAVAAVVAPVEEYLGRPRVPRADTIVVDPPRTGISKAAMAAVIRHGAPRVVYVSCDPATMARDARRLLDAGYQLLALEAFDLFPNTPHVESLGIFAKSP